RKCPSPIGTSRSRHSSLIDRTKRSAYAFAFGARTGVRTTDTRVPESTPRVTAPLPITIADQDVRRGYPIVLGHRQHPHDLLHEHRLGMRRRSEDRHTSGG